MKKRNNKFLSEMPIGKLLFKMSLPAVIGMLVTVLYNLVDTIFIGHFIGPLGIASVIITTPLTTIIFALSLGLGVGSGVFISIKLGEKKINEANKIFGTVIFLTFILSLLIIIISYIFIDEIIIFLGSSSIIFPFVKDYFSILIYGFLFLMLSTVMNNIIRAEGFIKIAMISMIIGTISNIILDYIFIVSLNLGISGAATATIISQFLAFLFSASYFILKKSILHFKFKYLKLNFIIIKNIINIGLPSFLRPTTTSIVGIIINNSIKYYGNELLLASYGILFQLMMVLILPIIGILQGSQPIIGYNYGAKKIQRVKVTIKLAIKSSTIIISIIYIFIMFYPDIFIKLFTNDEKLIEITKHIARIMMFFIPVLGFQFIASGFFQSIGKAKPALITSLLRQFILLLPLVLILPLFLGLDGLWYSYPIADFLSFLITLYLFRKEYYNLG